MPKSAKDTPVMQQYYSIKSQYPDAFLFFRMGDFYEMFGTDAVKGSRLLNITLTFRDAAKQIPLAGVPFHAADVYISRLLKLGHKVAICEQKGDPRASKGPVDREVVEVVTPGTRVSEAYLQSNDNNFIIAVCIADKTGIAKVDISTGDFSVAEFESDETGSLLKAEITKADAAEFVISEEFRGKEILLDKRGIQKDHITFQPRFIFETTHARKLIKKHFKVSHIDGFGIADKPYAISAAGALLHYLSETQMRRLDNIQSIKNIDHGRFMLIDSVTQKNLELVKCLATQKKDGSLLGAIDLTKTPMGSRMLKKWLLNPLLDKHSIENRLNKVEAFYDLDAPRRRLQDMLTSFPDIERILSRITLNKLTPRDLAGLKEAIIVLPEIKKLLVNCNKNVINDAVENWDDLSDIGNLIGSSISDSPPAHLRNGNVIKTGYDPQIDEYRNLLYNSKEIILDIESRERQRTGIEKLKVGFNNVFGYYLEVTKSKVNMVPDEYIRKQTLVNSERYITSELKDVERKVLTSEEKMITHERELFEQIRVLVADKAVRIMNMAELLAFIDILSSLAELARKRGYTRPAINDTKSLEILDSRHPVLEVKDPGFIPNDIKMDDAENRLLIITGPNMAGKSTYMRQVALITIMAQTGSFVPAKKAACGIVDKLFTRVGASDNIFEGQSTFMVEMCETANILNNATDKSLVILDEIGRGTSTYDGLSIAKAVAEYIHDETCLGARTLFATHYHEMTSLALRYPGIKNYNIRIKESGKKLIFLRKIAEGCADKSYGVHVARLAGMPVPVVNRAFDILERLETNPTGISKRLQVKNSRLPEKSLFKQPDKKADKPDDKLLKEIESLNLSLMTPIDALNKLYELQKSASLLKKPNSKASFGNTKNNI